MSSVSFASCGSSFAFSDARTAASAVFAARPGFTIASSSRSGSTSCRRSAFSFASVVTRSRSCSASGDASMLRGIGGAAAGIAAGARGSPAPSHGARESAAGAPATNAGGGGGGTAGLRRLGFACGGGGGGTGFGAGSTGRSSEPVTSIKSRLPASPSSSSSSRGPSPCGASTGVASSAPRSSSLFGATFGADADAVAVDGPAAVGAAAPPPKSPRKYAATLAEVACACSSWRTRKTSSAAAIADAD